MADLLDINLRITISELLDFLSGESIDGYGDSGIKALEVTRKVLYDAFNHHLEEARTYRSPNVDGILPLVDEYLLLDDVLGTSEIPLKSSLRKAGYSDVVISTFKSWFRTFRSKQIMSQLNQRSENSTDSPSSKSQETVPMMINVLDREELVLEIRALNYELDIKEPLIDAIKDSRVEEIVSRLMSCMKDFLSELSIIEVTSTRTSSTSSPRSITPSNPVGGQGSQDGTTPEFDDWRRAWAIQFHGSALLNLETKLQLNVRGLKSEDNQSMSRIIPLVQSSGTGKSRLAEEYVKQNFAVSLALKNGSSFPPEDEYVSQYFKNALRLTRQIESEKSMDPRSPKFLHYTDEDKKDSKARSNEEAFSRDENSVYSGKWRFQRPGPNSKPKRWAAVARLRVAYFLAAFFDTMIEYSKPGQFDDIKLWRTQLLHSTQDTRNCRQNFWYDVIKATFALLYGGGGEKQKTWLGQENDEPTLSNGQILDELMEILKPSMTKFFENETFRAFFAQSKRVLSNTRSTILDLPFLFIVDEAAYLFHTNYMHSFMWVLDQPVMKILSEDFGDIPAAKQFFVLMLGTHSQISHFAPHYYFPSERYFTGDQHIASVFLSLAWDSALKPLNGAPLFESGAHISTLVQWGRPIWSSYYEAFRPRLDSLQDEYKKDSSCLRKCVKFAIKKLEPNSTDDREKEMTIFAILAIRLHLDLDFVSPSRASELVASKMRWLVDVDSHRKHVITTYGSEPILVEAAAYLMNSYDLFPTAYGTAESPLRYLLKALQKQLNHGHVNRGENGELTARLLLLLAKDHATREFWWHDKDFLNVISANKHKRVESTHFKPSSSGPTPPYMFKEAELFYHKPSCPYAFYHRAVPVKDFLRAFLKAEVYNQLEQHFKDTTKWASLDKAYVNFTHWALVKAKPGSVAYQKKGFFGSWLRQNAYLCRRNFMAVDLVIPTAFRFRDTVDTESVCYIVISIKNGEGLELIGEDFLPREAVEGVLTQKVERKRKVTDESDAKDSERKAVKNDDGGRRVRTEPDIDEKNDGENGTAKTEISPVSVQMEPDTDVKNDGGNESVNTKISPVKKHLNLRLTLNSLKFINPMGIPDDTPAPADSWITPSEDMPFIAFAMSMGMTDREEDLFIGEENHEYNANRIAFALRGLTNTYEFHDSGVRTLLRDICVRHDISGEYPSSTLDFRGEKALVAEARKPLDNLHEYLGRLSLENMEEEFADTYDEMQID